MRVSYFLLVFVASLIFSCQDKVEKTEAALGEVLIVGQVENPQEGVDIVLEKLDAVSTKAIDTTQINGNEFRFFVKEGAQSFYRINLFDRQIITFILSGDDEKISITADGSQATGDFTVIGSKVNDQKNGIDALVKKYNDIFQSIDAKATDAREVDDFEAFEKLRLQFLLENENKTKALKKVVWEATPNLSAIYGLSYLNTENEFPFLDSVATSFKESGMLEEYTGSIIQRVESMRKLAVGSPAPEISLPNPDGQVISLSSLKGKYVLIDFWAAWCRPCRLENPNVKTMYEAYADKGFEILGVSLDRRKSDWTKAIETDGLPWLHISDLQYFNSAAAELYEINAIPATYLIGPDGKILAKGLRGPTLRAKLKEIFG